MIKSFDGPALVQKHWASSVARYPEGSLTAREIIVTVPIDDKGAEEQIAKLNAQLTAEIYQNAAAASKRYMELYSNRPRIGNVIVRTDIPAAEVKAAYDKLSSRIEQIAKGYSVE